MFIRSSRIASVAILVCASSWRASPAHADDTASPAPSSSAPPAATDPSSSSPAPAAALSDADLLRLQQSLAADAGSSSSPPSSTPSSSSFPDLSQVNVGAALSSSSGGSNPDIAFILDTAGALFSVDAPDQRGAHDPRETGFSLQQLEMSVGASVDPFLRLDANLVFNGEGVDVEEAYATTTALPASLQLRAGRFLRRIGRINATHPHSWHFVDQPLVVGKLIGPEGGQGNGAELSWLMPLPFFSELIVAAAQVDAECCGRSYAQQPVHSPLDVVTSAALKQFVPLGDDLAWNSGLFAEVGPSGEAGLRPNELFGVDVMLRYRPLASDTRWSLTWENELFLRRRQRGADTPADGGGYTQLVWQIDPQWETGARYEAVSGFPDDPLDPTWTSWRHRGTAQVTYYPSHFARLRVQGSADKPVDVAGDPVFAAFLQLEVLIGAHGAHDY